VQVSLVRIFQTDDARTKKKGEMLEEGILAGFSSLPPLLIFLSEKNCNSLTPLTPTFDAVIHGGQRVKRKKKKKKKKKEEGERRDRLARPSLPEHPIMRKGTFVFMNDRLAGKGGKERKKEKRRSERATARQDRYTEALPPETGSPLIVFRASGERQSEKGKGEGGEG